MVWMISTGWQMTECLKAVIDPQDSQIVYAVVAYGIFKTTNGGKSWQERNNGFESTFTAAVIIDSQLHQTVYAATGTFRHGVFKTTDKGKSWTSMNNGLVNMDIHALIVDPTNSNRVYCSTMEGGVFMSEDAAKNWNFIGPETSQVWDFVIR